MSFVALRWFVETPLDEILNNEKNVEHLLDFLFVFAKTHIPAYSSLLLTAGSFQEAPFITKADFVEKYSLLDRSANFDLTDFLHCSSGSGGFPTFWQRSIQDEVNVAVRFEQIFRDSFSCQNKKTLAVVCFPMGLWVGGVFTTCCVRYLGMKGYKIVLTTPGNNIDEILRIVQNIGGMFDHIVLLGYPPFVKSVIDVGISKNIDWAHFDLKLVLAGEVFSEKWRRLVGTRAGIKSPNRSIVSIFGTADAGVLACETPLSSAIRFWLSEKPSVAIKLFGRDRLPSLLQYDPKNRYFEINPKDGSLVLTTLPICENDPNMITAPLIRYCIGDAGGIIDLDSMISFLKTESNGSLNLDSELATCRNLPFVWVFGRAFWTISLFGANVYVDQLMLAFEVPNIVDFVTGKFVLGTFENEIGPRLDILVELENGVSESQDIKSTIGANIVDVLWKFNSEYKNYVR